MVWLFVELCIRDIHTCRATSILLYANPYSMHTHILIHIHIHTHAGFETDPTVFYGSTHELHNFPGTGPDPSPFVGEQAKRERDRRIVDRYLHSGMCMECVWYGMMCIVHDVECMRILT